MKVVLRQPSLENPAAGVIVETADVAVADRLPAGTVRIALKLRPINPADIFSLMGVYPGFDSSSPNAVPGLEGMGVVVESASDKVAKGATVRVCIKPSTTRAPAIS
jgi:NADPH:quinone reductase-like Zn-dependent oxidoreductase